MPKNINSYSAENSQVNWFIWFLLIVVSIVAIIFTSKYASVGVNLFNSNGMENYKAKVIEIISAEESVNDVFFDNAGIEDLVIKFKCVILDGENFGKRVTASQSFSSMYTGSELIKKVEVGDKVVVSKQSIGETDFEWFFMGYYRFDKIIVLALVFALLLILIGRLKGLNALISLSFTAAFVFKVFLPWVLSGKNIYIGIALTAVFTIVMSLLLIQGPGVKGLVTIISCCIGTAFSALVPYVMNKSLKLSGLLDEDSIYLLLMNTEFKMDLVAIIYAGIIIGALGAVMDVATDIASSLYEITFHVPDVSFRSLFKSGMEISRDIMGTMTNTLVLAYIGSSLSSILLLVTYTPSLMELLNREMIIVELLQTFSGSIALLLTAPTTVLISSFHYTSILRYKKNELRKTHFIEIDTI